MNAGANIGDTVRATLTNGIELLGVVKHVPQDVDDSWILWLEDGAIIHIQQYGTIAVLCRKENVEE